MSRLWLIWNVQAGLAEAFDILRQNFAIGTRPALHQRHGNPCQMGAVHTWLDKAEVEVTELA